MIWKNCSMTCIYFSEDIADENWPCVVKIDEDEILVEYDDNGLHQYKGTNSGNDHFKLDMIDGNGQATLHRFPDSVILEGSWREESYRGMWRIELIV